MYSKIPGFAFGDKTHQCKDHPDAEHNVIYNASYKLWFIVVEDYGDWFGPVQYCPCCGEKLPFDQFDFDAYRRKEREEEQERERKQKEDEERFREWIKNQPDPNRDEVPEYNPLKHLYRREDT